MKCHFLLVLWLLSCVAPSNLPSHYCLDVFLLVEASATNSIIDINAQKDINGFLQAVVNGTLDPTNGTTLQISGTYNISARYCRPVKDVPEFRSSIQLLVHGATYNKGYWSGLSNPEFLLQNDLAYSWDNYANAYGYHTLAIDRLGAGYSSHPDPIQTVQASFEIEIIHQVVRQIRNGRVANTAFSNVIYVGHSYGSILGSQIAAIYPTDLTTIILTGFGAIDFQARARSLLTALTPAEFIDEKIFAGLGVGYLSTPNSTLREILFYSGNYDPFIPLLDFAVKDTTTVGELVVLPSAKSTNFTGDVLVITGSEDRVICPNGCGNGEENVLAQVSSNFPRATTFEYCELAATGHDINLHYSASIAFLHAHNWLHNISR